MIVRAINPTTRDLVHGAIKLVVLLSKFHTPATCCVNLIIFVYSRSKKKSSYRKAFDESSEDDDRGRRRAGRQRERVVNYHESSVSESDDSGENAVVSWTVASVENIDRILGHRKGLPEGNFT